MRSLETRRSVELRKMLEGRRRALTAQVRDRMRVVRTGDGSEHLARDEYEPVDGDGQSDIALTVLQMTGETIRNIDAALERLKQCTYGDCSQCGGAIAAQRLRALPFATRCTGCEEARERTSAAAARPRRPRAFDEATER
jgi:DnaK suppressor protein